MANGFMKRWYVVQVYPGYENIVKTELHRQIESLGKQDLFGEILIPSAKIKQFLGAGEEVQNQQLFPGYLIIEMHAVPEALRLVSSTPRVTRFLGGKDPVPLSSKEVDRVLAQSRGEVVVSGRKHELEVGREVDIKEGPFSGFVGIVDFIDEENERLTVMVSIFGRMTPVELSFDQIKH